MTAEKNELAGAKALDKSDIFHNQDITREITLPSRGLLYEGKVPGGKITIRGWRTPEVKKIVSARRAGPDAFVKAIDEVVDRCTIVPNGMTPGDLLFTDGYYAMLSQRILSYSPHYKVELECDRCDFKDPNVWLKLDQDLNERPADPMKCIEPILVTLPRCGLPVELRLLRRKEAPKIAKYAESRLQQTPEVDDPEFSYRMALQIQTIDGVKEELGKKHAWVEQLHAGDLQALDNACEEASSGVDPRITKECRKCRRSFVSALPLTMEFFRPRATNPPADTGSVL